MSANIPGSVERKGPAFSEKCCRVTWQRDIEKKDGDKSKRKIGATDAVNLLWLPPVLLKRKKAARERV